MGKRITALMDNVVDWFNERDTAGITLNSQGLYVADAKGIYKIPKNYATITGFFTYLIASLLDIIPFFVAWYVFTYIFRSLILGILFEVGYILLNYRLHLYDKLIRIINRILSKIIFYHESNIIVPWSKVKSISTTNERFEKLLLKAYVNLGDWYIETSDGNNIVIKDIEAPESKLEYIRNKFKLKI